MKLLRVGEIDDFVARSFRYEELNSDPRIGCRTSFFGAAAVVTRLFSVSAPSPFLASLSAALELPNVGRAARIRAGLLYADGGVDANTAQFIRFEQCLIERALAALAVAQPALYETEIARANRSLAHLALWCSRWRSKAHRQMHIAVRIARDILGRTPDFAAQYDREIVGRALACEVASGG
jgi:hypothetical protein